MIVSSSIYFMNQGPNLANRLFIVIHKWCIQAKLYIHVDFLWPVTYDQQKVQPVNMSPALRITAPAMQRAGAKSV
jgi:hypothetical protein